MDRVICGDVGYGKTEVAVRAAFKAVQDGKQVAVLVPTTLLAHQHLQTFTERMSQFPVTIKGTVAVHPDLKESDAISAGIVDGSRSTSSSAPTGCCSRPSGSRTSGW